MNVAVQEEYRLGKKIVSISSKRQITIPQKFFTALGFNDEAECVVRGNELVIRPVQVALIKAGLSGEALLVAFKKKQAQVRPAVQAMIEEAESVARGVGEYSTYEDVFGLEDEE